MIAPMRPLQLGIQQHRGLDVIADQVADGADCTQPWRRPAEWHGMPRTPRTVHLRPSADDHRAWTEAARREGLSVEAWLVEAARLAIARGSTR